MADKHNVGGFYIKAQIAFLFLLFFPVFSLAGEFVENEILGNDAIVRMVKAGLSERSIIEKIKISRANFDTSTDGLIKLKGAGIPDSIMAAILSTKAPGEPSAAESPPQKISQGMESHVQDSTFKSPNAPWEPSILEPPPQKSVSQGMYNSGQNPPQPIELDSTFSKSFKSLNDCEARLARFIEENPDFNPANAAAVGRMGSFQLNADNNIQIFGSLSGRSAKCFSIKRRGRIDEYSDKTLVSFDGRMFVFHDFWEAGKDAALGAAREQNIGNSRTPNIRDARVTTQITNPPPSGMIIMKKKR